MMMMMMMMMMMILQLLGGQNGVVCQTRVGGGRYFD